MKSFSFTPAKVREQLRETPDTPASTILPLLKHIDYAPTSFEPFLKRWCRAIQPECIVEWGPGRSTAVMHDTCPDADIYTFEQHPDFAEKYATRFSFATVIHLPVFHGGPSEYSYYPLKHDLCPDLVFIDGRRRVECLLTAAKICGLSDVVLLHDCWRPAYRRGLDVFRLVEAAAGTAVLTPREK